MPPKEIMGPQCFRYSLRTDKILIRLHNSPFTPACRDAEFTNSYYLNGCLKQKQGKYIKKKD
jgi:hypothetical protein